MLGDGEKEPLTFGRFSAGSNRRGGRDQTNTYHPTPPNPVPGGPVPSYLDIIYERIGVRPMPEQSSILMCNRRFVLVAGGEQAGKSVVASLFLMRKYFEWRPAVEAQRAANVGVAVGSGRMSGVGEPSPLIPLPVGEGDQIPLTPITRNLTPITQHPESLLFWLVGASYGETQREFSYLVEWFGALGLLVEATKRVDPGSILLVDGTRIETKSALDNRTLSKEAPDGIIGCEASQLDVATFDRMRGRVTPRKGWLFLAGTFESSVGWYPQLFTAWQSGRDDRQSFSLPSWTNHMLYPGGRDDPELLALQADSTDEFYVERIGGEPVPPRGLVIPEIRPDIHVREFLYSPNLPVRLAIDPGYAGAYAVEALQYVNGQEVIIDEIYERGLVTEEIIEIAQSRLWWSGVDGGVIDVAGYQHQAMAAPAEVWLDKAGVFLSATQVPINDGTERFRSFLKVSPTSHEPKLLINSHCTGILSELGVTPNPFDGQTRAYRWKTDREGNVVGPVPEDRYNHGVKAVVYYLVDKYGYTSTARSKTFKVKRFG